jgi:hypothetical protein
MLGWRGKIVKVLVIYFAGFATAIYALVPGSADQNQGLYAAEKNSNSIVSFLKSDDFAISFRKQIDRSITLGKVVTCKLGDLLREKYSINVQTGQKL